MAKKCEVIWQTAELYGLLANASKANDQDVLLRSDHYLAVGCDLRNLELLDGILSRELVTNNSIILCTAEVSITYMDVEAADAVIEWASRFDDGQSVRLIRFVV